jgi:NAD(P)-dependent dehydrogenase (short-subunit alcohol dehydrogenase family)
MERAGRRRGQRHLAGRHTGTGSLAYAACKAALATMTKSLARALAPTVRSTPYHRIDRHRFGG